MKISTIYTHSWTCRRTICNRFGKKLSVSEISSEIDWYIPADLYHVVAEILAYVYQLQANRKKIIKFQGNPDLRIRWFILNARA